MDSIIIQSLSGPNLPIPISLRQKSGETKHFQMNCEIKYNSTYVEKSPIGKSLTKLRRGQSEKFLIDDIDQSSSRQHELSTGWFSKRTLFNAPLGRVVTERKHQFKDENVQILCYLRDDIEKYKMIAEKKSQTKSSLFQDAFIRRVFHKMRTPLHVICNSLGISEVTLEELSEVRYHAEVLLGVVEDLAFATMFETGKLTPLNLKPIHIVSMLSEVLEAAYATDERGTIKDMLRLSIRCSSKVPQVVCADSSLQRILFNLVSNAMQHCAEKGEVSLSVHYSHPKPPSSTGPPQMTFSEKLHNPDLPTQSSRDRSNIPRSPNTQESPARTAESVDSMRSVMAAAAVLLEDPDVTTGANSHTRTHTNVTVKSPPTLRSGSGKFSTDNVNSSSSLSNEVCNDVNNNNNNSSSNSNSNSNSNNNSNNNSGKSSKSCRSMDRETVHHNNNSSSSNNNNNNNNSCSSTGLKGSSSSSNLNIIYSTTDNSPSNLIYTAKQSSFNSTGSNTSNKEKLNEEDKDKSKVKERDKYKERDKDKDKEIERERDRERDKDRDKEKECKDTNSCSSSCSSVSSRTSGTANQKKDRDSGYFTFIISNSTFEKIDVEDIKKSFLRTKSFGGYQPDEPSPTRRASFGQGAYMDFSLERPDTPHPVLSKYDKKLRANSKSELPQKKRDKDKDNDKDKEESQLRLSSLTTDLTSCRGIGIGLQTAYNMVQVMGGQLECSGTDTQTVFWFTVHLEVAASGEYQYRSWSRRPSPFDSRRNSPYDSKKNSPFQSRKGSPLASRRTSPQDSKCNTAPGTPGFSPAPSPLSSALSSPREGFLNSDNLSGARYPGVLENLYPFRMSSSDEMNGTGTSSMSNRCFDNSHSINNTPSQSQKQLNTSGKRATPSTASTKGPSSLTLPRHADRPVLEINCDLANDPPTHSNPLPQGGEREADSRTRNNSGLSDTGSTAPLHLSLPVPSYKIPALSLHAYSSSSSSGSNCIGMGMGSSPEDNLDPEGQQSGFERTSLCCEFDDHFKEMQSKRAECDKRNQHIFVSEANTAVVKKILIVDDSVLCQKIIIKVLDGANYSFETAGNGRDACEKLSEKPLRFDGVLMDLRMPVMDGIEATRYIRDVLLLDLPIIALTAEIGIDARTAVLNAGANSLISKPAQAEDIIRTLDELIYLDF